MHTGRQIDQSIQDHGGPIRAITAVPGVDGYATCSNDGTVILRDSNGHQIGTMYHPCQEDGSPPFVLDVCSLDTPSGLDTVSCGEDGSVCVWQGTGTVNAYVANSAYIYESIQYFYVLEQYAKLLCDKDNNIYNYFLL